MFHILRRTKRVPLENLILNRESFAQTVENLFALSFLVKDGRAEISLDENRLHYVCKMCFHLNQLNTCFLFLFCTLGTYAVSSFSAPKNAPAANLVSSKEVSYTHFVFRYDYQDWKVWTVEFKEYIGNLIQWYFFRGCFHFSVTALLLLKNEKLIIVSWVFFYPDSLSVYWIVLCSTNSLQRRRNEKQSIWLFRKYYSCKFK